MQRLFVLTLTIVFVGGVCLTANSQTQITTISASSQISLPGTGPLFHNEVPTQVKYTQPDGTVYTSYDNGRTWRLVVKGTGILPSGIHHLKMKNLGQTHYTKNGVKYVSYNGGHTFWKDGTVSVMNNGVAKKLPKHSSSHIGNTESFIGIWNTKP